MKNNNEIKKLWQTFTLIENIEDRIILIFEDTKKTNPEYKILVEEDPEQFFNLLGGNEDQICVKFWASEYLYQDYIEENELEYEPIEFANWNIIEKSIEREEEKGYGFITGDCVIKGPENIQLNFEFEFNMNDIGYELGDMIGTPYDKDIPRDHGILLDQD